MIFLAGAHRTGKSTLAAAWAKKHKVPFVQTDTASIMRSLGIEPNAKLAFSERLAVQRQILERTVAEVYRPAAPTGICDRSPLDMLAYTMVEVAGHTLTPELEVQFQKYLYDCYHATNRFASSVIVVQPGIPIVAADGKAPLSKGFMEHFNAVVLGLLQNPLLDARSYFIPRDKLDLDERVECVSVVHRKGIAAAAAQRDACIASGVAADLH